MSKFNRYAKELDTAYKNALSEYAAAYQKMDDDKKAAARSLEAARVHNDAAGAMMARAKDMEAEKTFKEAGKRIWDEFNRQRQALRADLQKELKEYNAASPDAVDANALELLKSGMMGPDDYVSFVEKYDTNPTMLRMIGKFAADAAKNATDDRDSRRVFISVAQACKDGQSKVMRAWEDLSTIADYCSGQSRGGRTDRPEHILSMGKHWEELSAQAIETF